MSYETIRISELAKELALTSKEVVEKFAQIGVTGKTHSSTVTVDQISRLKDFIANGGVKKVAKPKAFVVKKVKADPKVEPVEEKKSEPKEKEEKPVKKVEKVERPKVEVIKQPVSRLEIVRRAKRPAETAIAAKKTTDKKTAPKGEKSTGEKKFNKGEKSAVSSVKKPLERRIIPQEIYENKTDRKSVV